MNSIDANKKLRVTFQSIIIVFMAFVLINLYLPSSFSGKSVGLLVLTIISCVGLVAIGVRVNCKNVKKWEMIIYYLLNIAFVFIIVSSVIQLSEIAVDVARNKIPYASGTEEYYDAYEDIESEALSSMFAFVLFGFPCIIMSIIFAIIGIIMTCVKKSEIINNETVLNVEQNQAISTNNDVIENSQQIDNNSSSNMKANYCKYCGKPVDEDTKFCKYCGKEIR